MKNREKKSFLVLALCILHINMLSAGEVVCTSDSGDDKSYMLTYFRQRYAGRVEITAEGKVVQVPLPEPMDVERLHIALSDDGLHWTALNDNEPVWEQQMRDPYVRRSPDGVWRLLATGGGRRPDRDQSGPSCLYATSEDLITWKVEGLLPLMKDVRNEKGEMVRNIWAPEWFYDEKEDNYLLVWSSSFEDAGWKKSRLWYCRTKDWKTFTPAKILFNPGYSVIDGTILEYEKKYYLFHKEEEFGERTGERRAIRVAVSDSLEGPYAIIDGPLNGGQIVPVITEGPSAVMSKDGSCWFLYYDYCMTNRFGVSVSADLLNWNIVEDASFPFEARHGTVSVITAGEAEKLRKAYGN